MASGGVKTRRQQREVDSQQRHQGLDSRSHAPGSAKCPRKEYQLLPEKIIALSDATDGDELRSSTTQLLYGRPVSSSLVRTGVVKYSCKDKQRGRTKRENSKTILKWGAKKVRTGHDLGVRSSKGCPGKRDPTCRSGRKRARQKSKQGLRVVGLSSCERKSCLPKMISNEITPTVAPMETCSKTLPQSPAAGPSTPVLVKQKRSQKRKSLSALCDVTPRQDLVRGDISRRKLDYCGQEVLSISAPGSESSVASEESQVQPAERGSRDLFRIDGYQTEYARAKCNQISGRNGPSAHCKLTGSNETGCPDSAYIETNTSAPAWLEQSGGCLQVVIPFEAQGNQYSYQPNDNSYDIAASAKDSNLHSPAGTLSVRQKARSVLKQQAQRELELQSNAEHLSAGCEHREDGGLPKSAENQETEFLSFMKSRSGMEKEKLPFDLNEPAQINDKPRMFLDEEPADPNQKRRKTHTRPKVLKDVIKPVGVTKVKKASTPRKAQSTKSKRRKKTDSQTAQMTQEGVSLNCNDCEQVEMKLCEDLPPPKLRMRAAARSRESRRSIETDLSVIDVQSMAIVVSNPQRAIVPYAKSRQKPFKPKVRLRDTDLFWWKVVMAHGPSYEDKNDGATAEKWSYQRSLFKERAEEFIRLMKDVQGNRQFSQWKGSVIDSVVGAFLTQNVSDHLSSSAFMLLASKYPVSAPSREQSFIEVRVEELQTEENFKDATPSRIGLEENEYFVEEPTTENQEEHAVNGTPSIVEELENEHMEFWQSGPKHSVQNFQANMETQHQGDDSSTGDVRSTISGDFKIRDALEDRKSSQKDGVKDSVVRDQPDEATVGSLLTDPVQNTTAGQLPSQGDNSRTSDVRGTISGDFEMWDGLEDRNSRSSLPQQDEGEDLVIRDQPGEAIVGNPLTDPLQNRVAGQLPSQADDSRTGDVRGTSSGDFRIRDVLEEGNSSRSTLLQEDEGKHLLIRDHPDEATVWRPLTDPVQNAVASELPSQGDDSRTGDVRGTSSGDFKTRGVLEDRNSSRSSLPQEDETKDLEIRGQPEEATVVDPLSDPVQNTVAGQLPSQGDDSRTGDVRGTSSGDFKIRDVLEDRNSSRSSLPQEDEGKDLVIRDQPEEATVGDPLTDPVQKTAAGQLPSEDDDSRTGDVRGTSSDYLKIRDMLEVRNSSQSILPQEDEGRDSLMRDPPEEARVGNLLTDPVQKTAAVQLPSQSLSSLKGKVSYNGLTGSERAKLEQNKTKSKDKVDWEEVRKKFAQQSFNDASQSLVEDAVDWESVRHADVDEIAVVIKERGMNNMLAGRIKGFLNRVQTEHRGLDLEWLRTIPPEEAKKFLLSIHGLGLKSAECVRLLTLRHLAFPVDTNVGRICVRLGWVPIEPLPEVKLLSELETYPVQENIQKYLWPRLCTLDQETLYELHYQMITFGKVFCTKRDPNCSACPLRENCSHYRDSVTRSGKPEITLTSHSGPSTSTELWPALPPAQGIVEKENQHTSTPRVCEPIIEHPPSSLTRAESRGGDMVDSHKGGTAPDANVDPPEVLSTALVVVSADRAARPVPKLKSVGRLRTVHYVYELNDDHPLVRKIGCDRVADDPCPILLAIWGPGESPDTDVAFGDACRQSEVPEASPDREDTVKGTLLVPCRTANRGAFPLNGTYFQVNEVFADHRSSIDPISVPRRLLWNLTRRFVYFGTSVTSIFKGLTVEEIQYAFQHGYICVRGFDSVTRAPKPLQQRLHSAASLSRNRQKQQGQGKNGEENGYAANANIEKKPSQKGGDATTV